MKDIELSACAPGLVRRQHAWLNSKWLPVLVGLICLTGSIALSQKLITHEEGDTVRQVRLEADAVAQEISARIDLIASGLVHVANRWDATGAPREAEWASEARLHLTHCPCCRMVAWVDSELQVRWLLPANSESVTGRRDLSGDTARRRRLMDSAEQHTPLVWYSEESSPGGRLEIYVPIFTGEEFHGYILGTYGAASLFDMLLRNIARRHSVAISYGQREVYRRLQDDGARGRMWSQESPLFGGTWHVSVWPNSELLSEIYYPLPEVAMLAGPTMALLLALAIYLAQTARRRTWGIEAANRQLASQILERERAQAALAESEERYRALYDNIPSMYVTLDRNGNITSVNRFGAHQFGYRPEELIDRSMLDLIHPADRADVAQHFLGKLKTLSQEAHYEFRKLRKDGEVLWASAIAHALPAPDGSFRALVNCRDITERKEAEHRQLATLRYLDSMNQVAEAIAKTMDMETMVQEVIRRVLNIFDCDRAWLLHPCDPDAPSFRIPYQHCRPGYPRASTLAEEVPMTREVAALFRSVLSTDRPTIHRPGDPLVAGRAETSPRFRGGSSMAIAVHTKVGKPWMLGLHQCSREREWSEEEQRLFRDISYRLADALNDLLLYRNLQDSEQKYRSLFENSLDGIYRSTPDGRFLDANPALVKMLGYRHRDDLLVSEEARQLCQSLVRSQNHGAACPLPFRTRDDRDIWIESNCRDVSGINGDALYYEGIVRDVTERERSQAALRESEERFRAAFENAGVGMALVAPDGRWLKVNRSLCEMLGYAQDELLDGDFQSVVHPDALEGLMRCMRDMLAGAMQACQRETRFAHRLGHVVWVLLSSSLVRDPAGQARYFVAQAQDISAGTHAKQALDELLERFNLAIRGSNDGLWDVKVDPGSTWDAPEARVWYSPRFKELMGFRDEEMENTVGAWASRLHPDDRERVLAALRDHVERRTPYDVVYRLNIKSGEYRWFSARGQAIWNDAGRLVRVAGSMRDITKAKELEQRQATTLRYLEAMDQISQALAHSLDIETMLQQAIQAIFRIFDCDRAWLLNACDPGASSFRVPYECTRPEYPGAGASGEEIGVDRESSEVFRTALLAAGVVCYGTGKHRPSDLACLQAFGIRSQMIIAIRPKLGKPWLLGMHQCSHVREWTREEQHLFRDISHRITDALNSVLLHRDLQRSEEKYRSLFENSLDGMYRCTADGSFIDVNPALVRMLGYDSKEELLLPEAMARLYFSEEDRQWWPTRSAAFPIRLRRKDGCEIWVESNSQPILSEDHSILYFEGIVRDVTDRRQAEAEMTRLLEENRMLTQQSIVIQEEERRSLARELHDELGQCLTAIKADAVSICRRSEQSQPQIFESASAIVSVSSHVYDVVRSIMRRLRPAMLDELGLVETLNDTLSDWRARYPDVDYGLRVGGKLDGLGEAVNITLYRIVQECLTNVAKHAGASSVDVRLTREAPEPLPALDGSDGAWPSLPPSDLVKLLISDNGRGMDISAHHGGLGILGMRERVQALKGHFVLHSSPGLGVCVSVTIPVVH